jgi:hypothetical protein
MKRHPASMPTMIRTILPPLLLCLPVLLTQAKASETRLFVLPTGDDTAAGSRDAPLASLAGAHDRVRRLRSEGITGPVIVVFGRGSYFFKQPVVFSKQDSGTEAGPVTYMAAEGQLVRFTAGRSVGDWQPVTEAGVLARLPEAARSAVWMADLKAQGIDDLGKLGVRGFAAPNPLAEAELFCSDQPMTLARWPNEGFRGVKKVLDATTVLPDTARTKPWHDEADPWVFAYWHHDWAELFEPIAGIDKETGAVLRSADVKPQYGITAGQARWYGSNLLCELDAPGEYYLDRQAGRLYFWPPQDSTEADLATTVLSQGESLLRATDLAHVRFQGFTIEACRGTAVQFVGCTDCEIVGCTVRNVGHSAVSVSGGRRNTIYGCDIHECGTGGITMSGGDRKTLSPAGHTAENNHIFRYSRRARTYRAGIAVSGVGNQILRNLIHHGPHMAISAGGNDHLVAGNEVHNVVAESGDAGAYYVGRDWTQRGNVLRDNYWHDIVGATGHGGMTIYLDDQHSGHTISGNVFQRCSRAVFIGGGDDNLVVNNLFIDCHPSVHIDNRGMGWQKAATDDPQGTLRTSFAAMPVGSDLWKERYPTLAGTLEDEPNIPKRNRIIRNISVGGRWDDLHKGTLQFQTVEDNLVFDDDADWARLETDSEDRPKTVIFEDPAAVDKIGFEPLALDRMGLYADPRRASWPVERQVDPIVFSK